MTGYLNQDEIDALLKGITDKTGPTESIGSEQPSERQSPKNRRQDDFFADRGVNKSPRVERVEFVPFNKNDPPAAADTNRHGIDFFQNISFELSGELGATEITVRDFLQLTVGSVIKLNKMAGENATILLNGRHLGLAEVVVINDHFGLRVTEIAARAGDAEKVQEGPAEEKSPPEAAKFAKHLGEEKGPGG